ncbi:TfoX-like protein [Motilibacter peucedani]|uniref:TfoX-like protein n=1 Tax=Motilibacter peucedani TaxID=598650 RepID=A0A420XRF1_9ACTN|nr:TfoX/Sxy family protein [Motilibacter peucedani]RKS77483.1 TfoX-like protein [Motilibacter peucedani]
MDKSPPELVERFEELATLVPGAVRKQMFGYPCCVVGGHMFASLFEDSLVLRLAEASRSELMETHEAVRQFEPRAGRPMTGFVRVPGPLAHDDAIEAWVLAAYEQAAALPPKAPKR